jgi:hypothetical protein
MTQKCGVLACSQDCFVALVGLQDWAGCRRFRKDCHQCPSVVVIVKHHSDRSGFPREAPCDHEREQDILLLAVV